MTIARNRQSLCRVIVLATFWTKLFNCETILATPNTPQEKTVDQKERRGDTIRMPNNKKGIHSLPASSSLTVVTSSVSSTTDAARTSTQMQQQHQQHDIDNNELTVVIHIGPMKTGSSAIQESMFHIFTKKAQGSVDNYEDAGISMEYGLETYNFISCFKPFKNNTGEEFMVCKDKTLQQIPQVAARQHNLILSAEYLTSPEVDIEKLKNFLQPMWKKHFIIAFYRRYYEWLVSFHNQGNKNKPIPERSSIVEFLEREHRGNFWWQKMYLVDAIERWRQYFPNYKIINMYEQEDGDVREQFYCDALPNAPTACSKIRDQKELEAIDGIVKTSENPSIPFVYEEIAYYGLVSISSLLRQQQRNLTVDDVSVQVQHYQEKVLNRTKYDFGTYEAITCPTDDTLQYLFDRTDETERNLFLDYYTTKGKNEIRKKFAKDSTTKLCHYDGETILNEDTVGNWKRFFRMLVS